MQIKKILSSSAIVMAAALIISLITNQLGVFPDEALTTELRPNLTILLLAIMMTLSLSRIPSRNLSPFNNPKSILRGILMGLIISAVIPIVGFLLLKDTQYASYAEGLVFIAATPFAASVAPLSMILRGDAEHAVRSTMYVYVASLLWIPLVVFMLLGEKVDILDLAKTTIYIIGAPLVVSRFITWVKFDRDMLAIVLNLIIAFLVWLSVSPTSFNCGPWLLIAFGIIAAVRSFGLGLVVEVAERRGNLEWSQRVTDILMVSYKNKGIAIALCVATAGVIVPHAMVAIATSIVVEICWVIFMDSVLFSKRRMERELSKVSDPGDASRT